MNAQRLSRDDQPEVVSVLMSAFYEYPVIRFVLRNTGAEFEDHLKGLVTFYTEVRYLRNWPVLGIRHNGKLVAVALVNDPVAKPLPLPQEQLNHLRSKIGDAAFHRLELYEEKSSEAEPKKPHHFLGMIGVLPENQGKGYGASLLNAVKEMSTNDPNSTGICLSTESSGNVPIYEHFGYHVISEVDIEGMHSWCMFNNSKAVD
jgi:GNAT superfamily N-acetyltransferase